MKKNHNYKNNFSEHPEYQKALDFLEKGCECGCYSKIPREEFAELRVRFHNLSKKEKDAFVMAQLLNTRGGKTSLSKRLKNKERTNQRNFYQWDHNTPICLDTYLNMLGISHIYLESIQKHLVSKNLITRIHGNTERTPQWKTKMSINQDVIKEVNDFLLNYAEKHGSPDPGKTERITKIVINLPTHMNYSSVYREFSERIKSDGSKHLLKYELFRRLWHRLTPHIKFLNSRTDLCDTCHQFRSELHSCQDEKEKEQIEKKIWSTKKKPN